MRPLSSGGDMKFHYLAGINPSHQNGQYSRTQQYGVFVMIMIVKEM